MELMKFNPETGVARYGEYQEDTDSMVFNYTQDCQKDLDFSNEIRNFGGAHEGIKMKNFGVACHIPCIKWIELLQVGINPMYEPNEAYKYIEKNYPALLTTNYKHLADSKY